MASNHINIETVSTIGSDTMGAVNAVRGARDAVAKMYGIMAEFADDTAGLAAALGLVNTADAATVRSNFQNVKAVLEGQDVAYFINRLGQ